MNSREASAVIELSLEIDDLVDTRRQALVRAKQALDILATIEERVKLFEIVELKRLASEDWRVMFDGGYHSGESPVDVLGQLCQVLNLDETRQPESDR